MSDEYIPETKPSQKLPKPQGGATKREKELGGLLLKKHLRLPVIGMIKRWLGHELDRTYHPSTLDDINGILEVTESCDFINLRDMRGWCKIWDEIHDHWERILELKENGDTAGLHRFLKELAAPYLGNSVTGDYSSSIYVKQPK